MKYTMMETMTILICQRDYDGDQMATIIRRYFNMDTLEAYNEMVRYVRMLKGTNFCTLNAR